MRLQKASRIICKTSCQSPTQLAEPLRAILTALTSALGGGGWRRLESPFPSNSSYLHFVRFDGSQLRLPIIWVMANISHNVLSKIICASGAAAPLSDQRLTDEGGRKEGVEGEQRDSILERFEKTFWTALVSVTVFSQYSTALHILMDVLF